MVKVKICGITEPAMAIEACLAGADAIGMVFYPPSSRYVDVGRAADVAAAMPPFVQRVGLFVDANPVLVEDILAKVELDLLQFHGSETAAYCDGFNKPYIKAIAMKPGMDVRAKMAEFPNARGFLLDTYDPGQPGGTGQSFNWGEFPANAGRPLVLAGGLTPDNVALAIRTCKPYAVDVSGGVEASKGKKSISLVRAFIRNAKSVEVM